MRLKPHFPGLALTATLLAALPHTLLPPAAAQDAPKAEPQPGGEAEDASTVEYTVELPDTDDDSLDDAVRRASALEQLRERAPVDAFGLVSRALADRDNMRDALRSEGYYGGTADITVAGEPPDTPGLADRLTSHEGPIPLAITVDHGPQYRLDSITAEAKSPGASLAEAGPVGLEKGSPARAQPIIDAQNQMASRLKDAGHPFVDISRRVTVDHDTHTMQVAFTVDAGPRAEFARPGVTGEERTDSDLVSRVVRPLEGKVYSEEEIEKKRQDLLSLGVFSTVRARAADRLNEEGRLPVTYTVLERPLHAIGFSAAYETRYGPTFSTYWEHRNLFGGAERLRLEAEVNRFGTTGDTSDTGGKLEASLRTPWFAGRNQTLTLDVAALRERLDAYDRDAFTFGALVERKVSPKLTVTLGPQIEFSRVTQDEVTTNYQLFGLLGQLAWSDVDSPLNPSRGLRAAFLVNPIYSLGEGNVFTRLRGEVSTYYDITGDKGSILALRGAVGSIVGASFGGVPPDKRFYAGGGGSVRGYDYQSIGPRTADDEPAGGLSLIEGTVELRQRVSGPWGMAAFVDAGSVTRDPTPDFSNLKFGAGLGVRYLTGIGPIRADFAVPLNKERGDAAFGFYVGIGQAF
ncbi:autotransporter assembly complex family protein [Roseomonas sp. E05]|uniref:autotransporter assembly complex protein TamA n=1 Tax=Roseomonas sp. E05 TaxID=3046310 RepID=UPI0024B9A54A|nr:autotransporter assembly complex family protein [Roseomonas sp. E05]MDJ0388161.1 autotransporter assembly complex family protein [Roseomonas sp. E05]